MKKRYFLTTSNPDEVNIQEVGIDGDVAYDKYLEEDSDEENSVALFEFEEGVLIDINLGREHGTNNGTLLHEKGGGI